MKRLLYISIVMIFALGCTPNGEAGQSNGEDIDPEPVVSESDTNSPDASLNGWVQSWGGPNRDNCRDIAIDNAGDLYVLGDFKGTVDFDPGPDELNFTANELGSAYLAKYGSDGEFIWAKTWDGFTEAGNIASDQAGNVYVTLRYSETIDFDPGPGVAEFSPQFQYSLILCTFDTDGNFIRGNDEVLGISVAPGSDGSAVTLSGWYLDKSATDGTRAWLSTLEAYGKDLAVDGSGRIYITGYYPGQPGPSAYVETDPAGSEGDAFLGCYDSDGSALWVKSWGISDTGSSGNENDATDSLRSLGYIHLQSPAPTIGENIALDNQGNIFVAGSFGITVDFDPGPGVKNRTSNGSMADYFLSKFDSQGNFQWVRTWGGSYWEEGLRLDTDSDGNAIVAGNFCTTIDFDPGEGVAELTGISGLRGSDYIHSTGDCFLSKFNSDGEFLWVHSWGGESGDTAEAVAVDNSGSIYIVGTFSMYADFHPGEGTEIRYAASSDENAGTSPDAYLVKFLSNGEW